MKRDEHHEVFLSSVEEIYEHLSRYGSLDHCTIQSVELAGLELAWDQLTCTHLTLIGCDLPEWLESYLRKKDVVIFPGVASIPYNPFRSTLYSWQELMAESPSGIYGSWDEEVYAHFGQNRFNPGLREALYQRIHDHAMDEALRRLLKFDAQGMTAQKAVGIMGGHSTLRSDPYYSLTAETARQLSEAGYLVVSGGGPGIMEAANLGAYFGNRSSKELAEAISHLSQAPSYQDAAFRIRAEEVLRRYPGGVENLAIPTWFYGHEPSNLFASAIAKYFSNSIREDNLLAISLYGVVFAPGSAGTTQEIFQDAAQNHYGTYGYISPMVFLGTQRYGNQTGLFPLLQKLAENRRYQKMLFLSDDPEQVVMFLKSHPPFSK